MPFINRPPKKARNFYSNKRKRNKTEKEKLRVKLYNNKKWKTKRRLFNKPSTLRKMS